MMLKRHPDGTSEIAVGEGPIVCLGGGPSLTQQQVDFVRGKARVIAINSAYLLCPWADLLYAPDGRWHKWHRDAHRGIEALGLTAQEVSRRYRDFPGQRCGLDATLFEDPAIHRLRYRRELGWSDDRRCLARGEHGHAGLQVLNLAALAGGDPIILLGYDAREPKGRERSHWHGDHPRETPATVFAKYRQSFAAVENLIKGRGIRVLNCSPGTAIQAFPMLKLEEAFATCAEPAEA